MNGVAEDDVPHMTRRAAMVLVGAAVAAPHLLAEGPFPFRFSANEAVAVSFRNEILNPGMTAMWGRRWRECSDLERVNRLRIWSRKWLDKGLHSDAKFAREKVAQSPSSMTLQDILQWRDGSGDGMCGYYSQFFVYVCHSVGIHCRRLWWDDGKGSSDQPAEVWVGDLRKWVLVAVLFNSWFSDSRCDPLSGWELSEMYHAGRLDEIRIETDGTASLPQITKATLSWAADVCIYRSNGDAMARDVRVYRYAAASKWPYPTLAEKQRYVVGTTSNPHLLYSEPAA